jgi:hypothetical protein
VCLRSLQCFPLDVLDASRCFIQVMLRHDFMWNCVFGLMFVEYIASIFYGVASALLGSACFRVCGYVYLQDVGFSCTRTSKNQNSIQVYTQCNRMLKYNNIIKRIRKQNGFAFLKCIARSNGEEPPSSQQLKKFQLLNSRSCIVELVKFRL